MTDSRAAAMFISCMLSVTMIVGMLVAWSSARVRARELSAERVGERAHKSFRFKRTERCFMHKINNKRLRHGRRRLQWDWQIGFVARRHARRMARTGAVWHDAALGRELTRWTSLGQNTGGGGGSCGGLFRRFWHSPGHRANILGRWRYLGVGAKWRDGLVYVQQVFEYRANPGNVFGYP